MKSIDWTEKLRSERNSRFFSMVGGLRKPLSNGEDCALERILKYVCPWIQSGPGGFSPHPLLSTRIAPGRGYWQTPPWKIATTRPVGNRCA